MQCKDSSRLVLQINHDKKYRYQLAQKYRSSVSVQNHILGLTLVLLVISSLLGSSTDV